MFSLELNVAKEIAYEAGQLLKQLIKQPIAIKHKGPVDLVTEADLKAEQFIVSALKKRFPNDEILTEEAGGKRQAERLWIIDPLDGTTNFAHKFPLYAVSLGLMVAGEVKVGVVYEPNLSEMFWAKAGEGAFLNYQPISVSQISNLNNSLLATGFPYFLRERPEEVLGYFKAFSLKSQGVRRAGAATMDLCFVACGRCDGFWELGLKPWDTAAASLILKEAGGVITKLDGTPFDLFYPEVLASNGLLHQEMLKIAAAARSLFRQNQTGYQANI